MRAAPVEPLRVTFAVNAPVHAAGDVRWLPPVRVGAGRRGLGRRAGSPSCSRSGLEFAVLTGGTDMASKQASKQPRLLSQSRSRLPLCFARSCRYVRQAARATPARPTAKECIEQNGAQNRCRLRAELCEYTKRGQFPTSGAYRLSSGRQKLGPRHQEPDASFHIAQRPNQAKRDISQATCHGARSFLQTTTRSAS